MTFTPPKSSYKSYIAMMPILVVQEVIYKQERFLVSVIFISIFPAENIGSICIL